MSPWGVERGGPLSDDDVASIVSLLRHWQTEPVLNVHDLEVVGVAANASTQYAVLCADCHGEAGEGGLYMSLNNPEFLATVSDGFLLESISSGRSGTLMQGYSGLLSEQGMRDLVALIRSWETPPNRDPIVMPDPNLGGGEPAINPQGEDPGFPAAGRYLGVNDLHGAIEAGFRLILLDARPTSDYLLEHISGAVSVPFFQVSEVVDQLPMDTWIVCYCGCPHEESGLAADALIALGYDKVKVLDEGFFVWKDSGFPVSTGPEP